METVHQCPHYMRKCHVEAPCCRIYYPCKLCHDQQYEYKKGCQVERMAFDQVKKIKCLQCQHQQPPAQQCEQCQTKFGEYTCLKCCLFENNPHKKDDIIHCHCKMCRRGTAQSIKHCFTCGYCIPVATEHKCITDNASSRCPICMEDLHFSTQGYIPMKCGHLIHVKCRKMLQDLNCPSCGMADIEMTQQMKEHIAAQIEKTKDKLPAELLDHKVDVLCNECLHKTKQAQFHFYGIACQKCGTYNTKMM